MPNPIIEELQRALTRDMNSSACCKLTIECTPEQASDVLESVDFVLDVAAVPAADVDNDGLSAVAIDIARRLRG